mmetsp:Transcript_30929/g.72523  ORF Transcript_30929/g.72523 Transcript_30929/m.72523 type:complete len:86 (+) Transcript_30929:370-627(+)
MSRSVGSHAHDGEVALVHASNLMHQPPKVKPRVSEAAQAAHCWHHNGISAMGTCPRKCPIQSGFDQFAILFSGISFLFADLRVGG